MISQAQVIGGEPIKTWDDYEENCKRSYGGGYRLPAEIEIFHHGMGTVFNLLRAEFPPAEKIKHATVLAGASERHSKAATSEHERAERISAAYDELEKENDRLKCCIGLLLSEDRDTRERAAVVARFILEQGVNP